MKPMRVAHVVPALFDPEIGAVGGAERYAFELARNMAGRTPTTLISFHERDHRRTAGDLEIKVLGRAHHVRGMRFNPINAALFRELLRHDVVHCHQRAVLASSLSALFGRLTGRKVFVTDEGGGGWDLSGYVDTDPWFRGHLHLSRYGLDLAGHGSNPGAHVIYGGVDVETFSPAEDGPDFSERPALFVGRLMPHKGVADFLNAVVPDFPAVVVGRASDPDYRARLHALAEGSKVDFREGAADDELVAAYRGALCVVLPSVYRDEFGKESKVPELLGQTLLEGMACGIPAICTDVASMPEVVVDGETGFVVPPNYPPAIRERLEWLRANPDRAAEMGRAGRRRVLEHFTWGRVVDRCLEIYRGQPATKAPATAAVS